MTDGGIDALGGRVRYGAALGLLLASVCGAVDALIITIWGHRTPYVLAPIVVLAYAMGGTLTGALLAILLHPRIPRHRAYPSPKRQREVPPTGRGQFVHALSAACLLGGLSAFAAILLVRTLQGYQGYMAAPAAWLPFVAGMVVAVLVATGGAGRRRSVEPGAAVGILFFAALFCGLWEPVNKLYQAPMLSPVGLAAKAAYLAAGAVLYIVLRRIIASMLRLVWIGPHGGPYGLDTTRRCATLALAVGAVGVLVGNATVWYQTPIPIDHQTPSPKRQRGVALRDKPNVILLVMDTAGANHLSTYGYSRKTTPHLTALAAEGVRYDRAIAPSSWTLASHASMFTGALPTEHRANLTVASGKPKRVPLSNDYVTLAEVLSAAGYSTGAIIANTGFLSRELGVHQGFDYYDDAPRPTMAAAKPRTILPGLWICRWYQDRLPGWRRTWSRNAEEINTEVLAWLDRRLMSRGLQPARPLRQPLFLFVNYLDPHAPYNEHPEFRRRLGYGTEHAEDSKTGGAARAEARGSLPILTDLAGDAARYDQEIAYLDARIGELLEALKLRGMYDNSLIIVTSDHGEAFGEHGWVGHGQLLYETLVHVPLVIRYPHAAVRGVEEQAMSLTALGGLILDEVGIEHSEEFNTAGAAGFSPRGAAQPESCGSLSILTEIILDDDSTLHAAYDDRMVKTILSSNGPAQVYDLTVDPRELADLSAERPEAIRCALGALEARSRRLVRTRTADLDPTAISARLQRQLKSLGYLD